MLCIRLRYTIDTIITITVTICLCYVTALLVLPILILSQVRQSLVQSLREDYQRRSVYVAYLIRCKQGLLNSIAHMEK